MIRRKIRANGIAKDEHRIMITSIGRNHGSIFTAEILFDVILISSKSEMIVGEKKMNVIEEFSIYSCIPFDHAEDSSCLLSEM
jgi:hypothetical protein